MYRQTQAAFASPLTDSDVNRLERLLYTIHPGQPMTLPEIDGYFCALLCGPNRDSMTARFEHVLGEDHFEGLPFYSTQTEAAEARKLLTRHWETIAAALMSNQPYFPLFDVDDEGLPAGNEWANGFIRGMNRDMFLWEDFIRKKNNRAIISLLAVLVAESNPELVQGGTAPRIPPDRRPELLAGIVACLTHFFRHFHPSGRVA